MLTFVLLMFTMGICIHAHTHEHPCIHYTERAGGEGSEQKSLCPKGPADGTRCRTACCEGFLLCFSLFYHLPSCLPQPHPAFQPCCLPLLVFTDTLLSVCLLFKSHHFCSHPMTHLISNNDWMRPPPWTLN